MILLLKQYLAAFTGALFIFFIYLCYGKFHDLNYICNDVTNE